MPVWNKSYQKKLRYQCPRGHPIEKYVGFDNGIGCCINPACERRYFLDGRKAIPDPKWKMPEYLKRRIELMKPQKVVEIYPKLATVKV